MSLENIEELFDQVDELYSQKKYDQAIEVLLKIKPDDGKENYALAQFNLGTLYDQQDKFESAEQAFNNVLKEDSVEQYTRAQVNLGVLYQQQDKLNEAEQAFNNVLKKCSAEVYTRAQFNLGFLYKQQDRFDDAEQAFKNILKKYSVEQYARAQLNLGFLYKQQDKLDDAEQAYKNVLKDDSVEQYTRAQTNLGVLYNQQDKLKEAEQAYKNVLKKYSAEAYARAQFNLGLLYRKQKQYEYAERAFQNILKKDEVEQFSKAQFNLGLLYENEENIVDAEIAYKKVLPYCNLSLYAGAQWKLYILTNNEKFLKKIKIEHDSEMFSRACYLLGALAKYPVQRNKFWQKIPRDNDVYNEYKYIINSTFKITQLSPGKFQGTLFDILHKTNQVLEQLFIESQFEESIAHYTNTTVSKLLLSYISDGGVSKVKSLLRLNTINLMNDPVEGQLLHPYIRFSRIQQNNENIEQAFIACFTLHHDSLNQFRLYGKKQQQEASGVSLVLNEKFFADIHNAASIYTEVNNQALALESTTGEASVTHGNYENKIENTVASRVEKKNLPAMPLYRCIYLDPSSNFISIAQREEWSFCREDEDCNSDRWIEYLQVVADVEKSVRTLLTDLGMLVEKIPQSQHDGEVGQLLNEILLPLQYLIKHMAFKEEQECRMVYVTDITDPLIQYDDQIDRVYIDYAPSLMQHLEKIYLAPKAVDEKTVFEYLCAQGKKHGVNSKGVKVKISQNPFR